MRPRRFMAGMTLATLVALAGCAQQDSTPQAQPEQSPAATTTQATATEQTSAPSVEIEPERRDIAYIDDDTNEHKLDLFLPEDATAPVPVLVWAHGGAWRGGDKNQFEPSEQNMDQLKSLLLENGYGLASVNYRLVPNVRFPDPVQDLAAGVRYLRAHAGELGIDPERFAIGGESAGGHLAAMQAYTTDDPEIQGTLGDTSVGGEVTAFVGYYGLYDLRTRAVDREAAGCGASERSGMETSEGQLLGVDPTSEQGRGVATQASPIEHVDAQTPPTILFQGNKDCTAPYVQAENLKAALDGAGVANDLMILDAEHASSVFYDTDEVKTRLLAFLDTHLKG